MTNQHLLTQLPVLISLSSIGPPEFWESLAHSSREKETKTVRNSADCQLHLKRPQKGQQHWICITDHSFWNCPFFALTAASVEDHMSKLNMFSSDRSRDFTDGKGAGKLLPSANVFWYNREKKGFVVRLMICITSMCCPYSTHTNICLYSSLPVALYIQLILFPLWHEKIGIYFCWLQRTFHSQVKHLACFVKCALIQAAVNTMASMPATAAVASSSVVWEKNSFTGEER